MGNRKPKKLLQHIRDSPKVKMFCVLSCEKVYRPFFFQETSVTRVIYLNMLNKWLMPQLYEDSSNFIFVQDGALALRGLSSMNIFLDHGLAVQVRKTYVVKIAKNVVKIYQCVWSLPPSHTTIFSTSLSKRIVIKIPTIKISRKNKILFYS